MGSTKQLEESQLRLHELVTSAMDGIISINERGEIVLFNPAAEKMFGYETSKVIGTKLDLLIPERFRATHDLHIKQFDQSNKTSRRMGALGEIVGLRSNGQEFPAEASISLSGTSGNKLFTVILRDVTERKLANEKLRVSEEQYRRIAETSEEGIWLIDEQDRTTFVNPKLASMLRYSPEEMMGKSLYDFMDAESAGMAKTSLEKRRQGINEQIDFRFKRKDGRDLWAIVAASPVIQDGKYTGALAMITDITERRKTQEELRASEERNRNLYESAQRRLGQTIALRNIDVAISNSLDLRFTLDIVLTQVLGELSVDAADILLYNETTHVLNFFVGQGFRTAAPQRAHIQLGKGYAGKAVLERKAIHVANISQSKTEFLDSAIFPLEEFEDFHCMPLIAKGKVLGVLETFNRKNFQPPDEWLDYLETLAGQAAIAIDNISLFEDLQRANDQLVLGYDATIEGWSRALDLRDKETEGHTQRVTSLTMQLAATFGIRDEEVVQVRRGALLHDIGKMGVPDSILHKPDKLNAEEWEIMRQHPVFAYQLLSPISYLQGALDIPYAHHEKWDGSGYPRGLKGEAIPFTARLFAVIDVYDALTSDRPYRKAWSKEETLEHIKEQSGTHFDPRVVTAFIELEQGGK